MKSLIFHKIIRTWLSVFWILVPFVSTAQTYAAKVDGFVTQLDSPTEFYVGSLRVILNGKTQCETQDFRSDIQLKRTRYFAGRYYYLLQSRPVPKSEVAVPCNVLSLRVGFRVQAAGYRGQHDGSFTAAQLIAYKVDIQRKFHTSWKPREWTGEALLEEKPQVSQTGQKWAGTLWLDGYPMSIGRDTHILPVELVGVSPTLFQTNAWAEYRGTRRADGHILLDRIGQWPNQPDPFQERYARKVAPTIDPPNYATQTSGSAVFPKPKMSLRHNMVLSILPARNVQDYVSRLGTSLIPQYQKALPETDATKVHFRFYVVQPDGATFDDEVNNIDCLSDWMLRPSWDDAVLALPNGVILVPMSTLTGVGNEAQLAAILSSAIASVLQGQSYYASQKSSEYGGEWDESMSGAIASAADWELFTFGFVLWRDEQAMRIGIRQMYLAGYDIREAPFAWAAAAGKPVVNPVMNPKYPNEDVPWETAYAFDYISQYYSDVDYSKLKKSEAEYAQFLDELRRADPEAFAVR